jgi:RHS repeat-associated protein
MKLWLSFLIALIAVSAQAFAPEPRGFSTLQPDCDGNRVRETVVATTTYHLVDQQNLTRYAQVLEERTALTGAPVVTYVYGLDLISQNRGGTVHYYGYDALGTVRYLTGSAGTVTDTYVYDAFGIEIGGTASTVNWYRYTGEQYDADLGMYYLRARYYKPELGRFWTMDSFEGHQTDPLSLHKYLYCHADPVNNTDPSGHFTITEMVSVQGIDKTLRTIGSQSPRVALRASRAKIWDVYWGLIPGWPPHGAVFAANKLTPSGAGYIYDVNPINPGPQAMTCSTIPGNIRIRPTTLGAFNRQYKVKRKVATLNTIQYIAWQFEMRLLIADESLDGFTIPIDYSFYGALSPLSEASNCLTWSLKAAGAAWIQAKFGN